MRLIRTLCLAVATLLFSLPPSSAEVVGVAIAVAPPPIPVYVQPPIPGPGYIWVPGYWAWGDDDYYWVPGTWVLSATVGYLWTPGYWYWRDTGYYWRAGYWGPRVGFYGGVNYGCGYYGTGYVGGHWKGRVFAYNTAVTNIGTMRITNVYIDKTVVVHKTMTNVGFHGGHGGTTAKPTAEEDAAERDKRIPPTFMQTKHQRAASVDRTLFAKTNEGKPAITTTAKAGQLPGSKASLLGRDARAIARPDALNAPSNSVKSRKGAGEALNGAGPKGRASGVPKEAALGSAAAPREIPREMKKDPQSGRMFQGRSEGPGGPAGAGLAKERGRASTSRGNFPGGSPGAGGAKEHSRMTTMRGGPSAPHGPAGRPSSETKRGPNHQGKRPDQE
jgi:hypothetical protein